MKQGRYAFAARLAEQARLIPREKQDVPPEERPALYMDYKRLFSDEVYHAERAFS